MAYRQLSILLQAARFSTSWVILVIFVMLGIALTGVLQIFQLSISERLQQRIFARASFEFAFRLPRLRMESVHNEYVPELVNRFFDTLSIQKGLSKILIDFSSATLQVFFGLLLLSFYHPFFIFFGLILLLIVYLIFRITGPRGLSTSLSESKYKFEVVHWLEEVGRNMETFKLAGNTQMHITKTDELVSGYIDARKKHFNVLVVQYINMVSFKLVVAAGLLIMGSLLVIDQQINLGQFVAAEIVILLIIASVEKLILSMETIYDVLTSLEKMGAVTDLPLEKSDGVLFEEVDKTAGMSVELKNLSFRYADSKEDVIRNFSVKIDSGERVCLSGYSGSGKSTMLQIIAGLYNDFTGILSYNDIPVGNLNLQSLRTYIGDSINEEKLFLGSLYENISLGRPGITLKNVIEVAEKVFLTDFVQNLRDGFETQIDPEGKNLPGSVVTKIMLARSLACPNRLLLVTDQLNRLDPKERNSIMDYMIDKKNPWTLIVISNQAEVAEKCDRVIIMDKGELLANSPLLKLQDRNMFYSSN
ncbi:MAG: ATP-binding cassette domain-containing protein [Cyclobacteriaceae bacterium]|nr:ATP-binding cassette domain-containing protein [Cyclobacteriaceae bacterium]